MADGGNRVPGGRGEGTKYIIMRAVFDRAMRYGQEPERAPTIVSPDLEDIAKHLRQRAAEDLELADRIEVVMREARRVVSTPPPKRRRSMYQL